MNRLIKRVIELTSFFFRRTTADHFEGRVRLQLYYNKTFFVRERSFIYFNCIRLLMLGGLYVIVTSS